MFRVWIRSFSGKSFLVFVLIILLAAFLRFYQLGSVPLGITNDEAGYMYSAYSVWNTGHDIAGKFLPLSFNLDNSFSPVTVYLMSPFIGIFGLSPFVGRLPFALAGIGSVILLYLIAKCLFDNQGIALAGMFVLAVSPWHLQFSRAAYDAGLVVFFVLLGTYFFIRGLERWKWILWSIPFFILAFYTYHATKIFLIVYIPFLILFYQQKLLKMKKVISLFVIVMILTLLSFLVVMRTQDVTRQNMLLWNDMGAVQLAVDQERAKNSAPFFLRQIFNNKPLYFLRVLRENYLGAFSPNLLFLYGEESAIAGTYYRGEFYIIELPLLILGLYYLFAKASKSNRIFIAIAILLSPIPSAVAIDKTYVSRSIMLLPFLSIVIGCGIYFFFSTLFTKNKKIFFTIFSCLYVFLIASYIYQYYSRYSIYGAESWHKSSRDLAIYMWENKDKNIYLVNSEKMFLLQYGIYNRVDPLVMQKAWQDNPRKMGNIVFLQEDCQNFDLKQLNMKNSLSIIPDDCAKSSTPSAVIKDFGEPLRTIWKIYEN
jgi:4-amino-4-deoxy-L-arabinose transferase-like glycosyltransferase